MFLGFSQRQSILSVQCTSLGVFLTGLPQLSTSCCPWLLIAALCCRARTCCGDTPRWAMLLSFLETTLLNAACSPPEISGTPCHSCVHLSLAVVVFVSHPVGGLFKLHLLVHSYLSGCACTPVTTASPVRLWCTRHDFRICNHCSVDDALFSCFPGRPCFPLLPDFDNISSGKPAFLPFLPWPHRHNDRGTRTHTGGPRQQKTRALLAHPDRTCFVTFTYSRLHHLTTRTSGFVAAGGIDSFLLRKAHLMDPKRLLDAVLLSPRHLLCVDVQSFRPGTSNTLKLHS